MSRAAAYMVMVAFLGALAVVAVHELHSVFAAVGRALQ